MENVFSHTSGAWAQGFVFESHAQCGGQLEVCENEHYPLSKELIMSDRTKQNGWRA